MQDAEPSSCRSSSLRGYYKLDYITPERKKNIRRNTNTSSLDRSFDDSVASFLTAGSLERDYSDIHLNSSLGYHSLPRRRSSRRDSNESFRNLISKELAAKNGRFSDVSSASSAGCSSRGSRATRSAHRQGEKKFLFNF